MLHYSVNDYKILSLIKSLIKISVFPDMMKGNSAERNLMMMLRCDDGYGYYSKKCKNITNNKRINNVITFNIVQH